MLKLSHFFKFQESANPTQENTFLIKVSHWRLEAYIFIKIRSSEAGFPRALRNFLRASIPANIHFDEDVFKTSFVFVFRRRFQDVLRTFPSRRIYLSYPYIFRRPSSESRWLILVSHFFLFIPWVCGTQTVSHLSQPLAKVTKQQTNHVESTLIRCRHYADTSKRKYR